MTKISPLKESHTKGNIKPNTANKRRRADPPKGTSPETEGQSEPLQKASIIITNIYSKNTQTEHTRKSFEKFHELAVLPNRFEGNGNVLRHLYECYKRAATGHELFAYTDGGDTFCQKEVTVPTDKIWYSAEKNCYPIESMAKGIPYKGKSPWKYLNGGNYGGPLKLMIEFIEKYGLNKLRGDCNGQLEQMQAFLQAKKDGFPIDLDYKCEVFQTTAFADPSEFEIIDGLVHNIRMKTVPAVLHGNGRSDMSWIYNGVK